MSETPGHRAATFVRRVHRRRTWVRCAEWSGIGAIAGALTAALFTIPLLAWRGATIDPIRATIVMIAIGSATAGVAALRRRPTLLDTAIEIDRQLRTDDLLSSCLSTTSNDAFAQAIARHADARLIGVNRSSLVLRRLAPRAWMAMTLALVASAAASMLLTQSPRVTHANSEQNAEDRYDGPIRDHARQDVGRVSDPVRGSESEAEDDPDRNLSSHRRAAQKRASARGSDDRGGARSQTNEAGETRTAAGRVSADRAPISPSAQTETSAGAGRAGRAAASGSSDAAVAPGVVARDSSTFVPPWNGTNWNADRDAARRSLRDQSIPDAYRELVREYFDIDGT